MGPINDGTFQQGYEAGYKLINGTNCLTPLTPLANLTPLGSTAFLEGIKAGLSAAGVEID